MIPDTQENIDLLAKVFYDKLCTKLTVEQIETIRTLNTNDSKKNFCNSYGVCDGICDPNEFMIEVFQDVFDEPFDCSNQTHKRLYDFAWSKILKY